MDLPSVWEQLQGQLYLGDAEFAEVLGRKMDHKLVADAEIPRLQRRKSAPSPARFPAMPQRNMAIVQACATGCYSMTEIAQAFEIHYATVSRIVKMEDDFWEMGDLTPILGHFGGSGAILSSTLVAPRLQEACSKK